MTKQEKKIKKDLEYGCLSIEKIIDKDWYYQIEAYFSGIKYHPPIPYRINGFVVREKNIYVLLSIQKTDL